MEVAPFPGAPSRKISKMKTTRCETINVSLLYGTGSPNPEYRKVLSGLDNLKILQEAEDPETFLAQHQEKSPDLALVDLNGDAAIPGWLEQIISRIEQGEGKPGDLEKIDSICDNILGRTICPLGDAAVMPIQSALKLFRDEFQYHIDNKKCLVKTEFEFK